MTDTVQANIIVSDPRKQTSGGRHQIGTLAGFVSESVAGFILELPAGFFGIRTVIEQMPAVGDLYGLGLATPSAFSAETIAIASDDLNARTAF